MIQKNAVIMLLSCIILVSFALRAPALTTHQPFWVDEFNTGTQARIVNEKFLAFIHSNTFNERLEFQNIPTHIITAASFSFFGESEQSARIPTVVFGGLLPLLVYYLTKQYTHTITALTASFLTATLYFQVLWSVQARGYSLLQCFIVGALILYKKLRQKPSANTVFLFLGIVLLGLLSHLTFLFLAAAMLVDYIALRKKMSGRRISFFAILTFLLISVLQLTGAFRAMQSFFTMNFELTNNVWYYHSFLWREYTLLTFLGCIGLVVLFIEKKQQTRQLVLFMSIYLFFVLFIYDHHMTKYLLPLMPLVIMGAAHTISLLSERLSKQTNLDKTLVTVVIVFFIVCNGDTFVIKPKQYYSLNKHFREIANIDYNAVYNHITPYVEKKPAIIETWPARAYWYLGNDYAHVYLFRWNEEGRTNGHSKQTQHYIINGEKRVDEKLGFISNADDLQKVMKRHKTGYLFIDDSSLPQDVIQYAQKNLKKEIYLDHYPLDDNPYSIWPATLYSWGVQ